ncbi:MAG: NAD-dependent deacetylase [Acidimicrobiaceae bacterium]|nr:NAD-dependent deacetylase [Acidimicrobiaceae bacterium]
MPIDRARAVVAAAERITVLSGAGISTDSGIPDFRGPQGVWTKNPAAERTSNLTDYLNDPEVRRQSWQHRLRSPAWTAEPNPGHVAVAALERQERLVAVLTQNIDGLHQKAGNSPAKVLELHGTMHESVCWECGDRLPMDSVLERVRAGEADPACLCCGGTLKSATISFGQALDWQVLAAAEVAAASCDLMLAVGSTLQVHPAASFVPLAKRNGADVVIVNNQPTPYDELADAVVREPISEALPALVKQ